MGATSPENDEFRGNAKARLDQHGERLTEHATTLKQHDERIAAHDAFIGLARLVLIIVMGAASLIFFNAQHLSEILLGISR